MIIHYEHLGPTYFLSHQDEVGSPEKEQHHFSKGLYDMSLLKNDVAHSQVNLPHLGTICHFK